MNAPPANTDPHADAMWVSSAFILFSAASGFLLLRDGHLSPASGSILWTVLFGGLLLSSIRLCVIGVEKVLAGFQGRAPWKCIGCGYDLSCLPDSWRCPECGQLYIDGGPSKYPPISQPRCPTRHHHAPTPR